MKEITCWNEKNMLLWLHKRLRFLSRLLYLPREVYSGLSDLDRRIIHRLSGWSHWHGGWIAACSHHDSRLPYTSFLGCTYRYCVFYRHQSDWLGRAYPSEKCEF